jgi:hypothetical protein
VLPAELLLLLLPEPGGRSLERQRLNRRRRPRGRSVLPEGQNWRHWQGRDGLKRRGQGGHACKRHNRILAEGAALMLRLLLCVSGAVALLPRPAGSTTKMSFTIVRNLEQLPSYPVLCKLAEQHNVIVTGDERRGSFSWRGVEGNYEFGEAGIQGKFAGRGVAGEFSFEPGKATVTVVKKPFWLPALRLKKEITQGLDTFGRELA